MRTDPDSRGVEQRARVVVAREGGLDGDVRLVLALLGARAFQARLQQALLQAARESTRAHARTHGRPAPPGTCEGKQTARAGRRACTCFEPARSDHTQNPEKKPTKHDQEPAGAQRSLHFNPHAKNTHPLPPPVNVLFEGGSVDLDLCELCSALLRPARELGADLVVGGEERLELALERDARGLLVRVVLLLRLHLLVARLLRRLLPPDLLEPRLQLRLGSVHLRLPARTAHAHASARVHECICTPAEAEKVRDLV